jgi:hypothetical protein
MIIIGKARHHRTSDNAAHFQEALAPLDANF